MFKFFLKGKRKQKRKKILSAEDQMVQNVIDLKKNKVEDCMIDKNQIVSVGQNTPVEILRHRFIETGYSKILVYKQLENKVVGYVHVHDILKKPQDIAEVLRPIHHLNASTKLDEALAEMIEGHISIAAVLNDEQSLVGMISLEDLIEEIFGEIDDEFDE